MAAILEVDGVSVRYGKVEALHGASIRVAPGQIVSVIGPNGAGKSTLLNAIMGALPPGEPAARCAIAATRWRRYPWSSASRAACVWCRSGVSCSDR